MAQRSLRSRLWYHFMQRIFQLAGAVAYRVRYTGRENIPAEGGVLVVSNHQSNLDPPLVGMGCPRQMNYLARESLFNFPPFRWMIRSLDAIPIDIEGIGIAGIKKSLRRLKRGEMVLIFPEGSRSEDGQIAEFLPGFTALAVRSRAAVLPMAIEGAYAAWPRHRMFPRLGPIRVHYGRPILPEEIVGRDEHELVAEIRQRVEACYARVSQDPVFRRRSNSHE